MSGMPWPRWAERFDYLVNNAGTSSSSSLETITEAEMDGLYNIHFKGVMFLTQKLLPLIDDGGRIVNISSGCSPMISVGSTPSGSRSQAAFTSSRAVLPDMGQVRQHLPPSDIAAVPPAADLGPRTFDLTATTQTLAARVEAKLGVAPASALG